ncbi:16S rRNA (guanine(527)-N(7))-methyltransferase RsmG [Cryptosporangium phraense]|uniref:Ribosomal RNA small subunit methyltransferase G n=1 Tax=Cryptosporangium phraense TaxID=2593070 RepID=A0A545AL48_9ACTN|nr:16S rRNA (guanine(527)-N(7))-methyltransferase RsmG [Cryptosporangium phraense]TQS41465.1 16S rRNA (guanine(527)-N(7))-methyltransferase RsmG [Cryptosporangium phraense]
MSDSPPASPAGPPAGLAAVAASVFGSRLPLAVEYASLLSSAGVERGLIGPREAPRLWERHLLNCAVVADLFPAGATVVDVGSGAGLPGIVLGIVRPDLRVTLLEPLARRAAFLSEAVSLLGLSTVTVERGRAEEVVGRVSGSIVTARAVAPLDRLAGWCLPLCAPGGRMLALKGSSAAEEITEHAAAVARVGGVSPRIVECGSGIVDPPTTVVEILRGDSVRGVARSRRADAGGDSSRRRRPGSAAASRRRRGPHGP